MAGLVLLLLMVIAGFCSGDFTIRRGKAKVCLFLLRTERRAGTMDILRLCQNYSTFKHTIKGSTFGAGFIRRWCFPALSEVLGCLAETHSYRFWYALPRDNTYWELVRRGYTVSLHQELFANVDLSNRGRVLSFLAFVTFLLKHWPADSCIPEGDRLDLICVPAWTRLKMWQQTEHIMQQLEEELQGAGAEEEQELGETDIDQDQETGGFDSDEPSTEG